jgi:hypothetical protein
MRNLFADAADLIVTDSVQGKIAPLLALLGNRRFTKTARWSSIFRHVDKLF